MADKQIKKVIHLSDVHIRTYRMHDVYENCFNKLYKEINEMRGEYDYDEMRIVIVGDIVHQKITISNEQIMLTSKLLNVMSMLAPVILIAGNHDLLENNKDRMDSLTPIVELLDNDNIHYFKESTCYPDNNIVWCNYSVFEDNARPDIESFRQEYGDDKKYIGLYHAPVAGSKNDKGFEFETGATLAHFKGCDVVMMGDIHKHQELRSPEGIRAVYSGSLIQQNYGESIKGHGYVIWNMEDLSHEFNEIENDYGFYQFKVNSVDDLENNKEILEND